METTKEKKNTSARQKGKVLRGFVVGVSMKDTAAVLVSRYVKHPKYKKFIQRKKKYLAHDPGNTCDIGDHVMIQEARPISKRKSFIIYKEGSTNV